MSANETLWKRAVRLWRIRGHKVMDKLETVEELAEQSVRDQEAKVAKARDAISITVGKFRMAQKDHEDDRKEHGVLTQKIEILREQIEEHDARGETETARVLEDHLDRVIEDQLRLESKIREDAERLVNQERQVTVLKREFAQMDRDLKTIREEKNALIARSQTVEAAESIISVREQLDMSSSLSDIGRLADRVKERESALIGRTEITLAGNPDRQIEDITRKAEIRARKAAILSGTTPTLDPTPLIEKSKV